VGVFVDRSVKLTTNGGHPEVVLGEKFAIGACPFTMNAVNRLIIKRKGSFLFNGWAILNYKLL
jgi:hypothetical protein